MTTLLLLPPRMLLPLLLTRRRQTFLVSIARRLSFPYLVFLLSSTRSTTQFFHSVVVSLSLLHPLLVTLVSYLILDSLLLTKCLLCPVHVSTTFVIFVASGLFSTSVLLMPSAHHSYSQGSITATPCTTVYLKSRSIVFSIFRTLLLVQSLLPPGRLALIRFCTVFTG